MNNSFDETKQIKVLISQVRALSNTVNEILNNSSAAETARYASFADMARTYNDLAELTISFIGKSSIIYTFNLDKLPTCGGSVWPVQKRILEQVLTNSRLLLSTLEGNVDFQDDEFDNIESFIKSRLRSAVFNEPEKEVEVQNVIESLLLGRGLSKGIDYDRESGKLEFSGKEYIPDFIIPKMSLCIEVKLLKNGRKSKMIEEISADITAYSKEYSRQLYVVYDLGVIQNENEFRRDIENSGDNIKVIVVKH